MSHRPQRLSVAVCRAVMVHRRQARAKLRGLGNRATGAAVLHAMDTSIGRLTAGMTGSPPGPRAPEPGCAGVDVS